MKTLPMINQKSERIAPCGFQEYTLVMDWIKREFHFMLYAALGLRIITTILAALTGQHDNILFLASKNVVAEISDICGLVAMIIILESKN